MNSTVETTGIGPEDDPLKNYGDVDRFIALRRRGSQMPGGTTTGLSYRIDHVLASSELLPRIRDCRYLHLERESGISDHSAILVEIDT